MSKRDKLTFTVKSSLVVGTATAALSMGACTTKTGKTISNPFPRSNQDTAVEDTSDTGVDPDAEETGADPDADESTDTDDGAETSD